MVGLMDPGRGGNIRESLTELTADLAFRAGFFQGERNDEDGTRKGFHQVVDALRAMRGARTGATTFDDHIDMLAQEMIDESSSMFENGSTREDITRRFREVQTLLGDPFAAAGGGDWAQHIRENKKALVASVAERLPSVVEELRNKPAVGPSGVAQLLNEVMAQLQKPADAAPYIEWFQRKRVEKQSDKQAAYLKWTKQVDHAVEAQTGFFKSGENHREAVKVAADAFRAHWKAAVHDYVSDQAVTALHEITRLLGEQGDRLRRICESMFELRTVFEGYRDFFAKPARATAIEELDVPPHLHGQLLSYYLGHTDDERTERLTALLARGLREMKLGTLTDLETALRKHTDTFRARLFKLCFLALKGDDGVTHAFRRTEDEAFSREGFIHRYSAVKMLAEQAGDEKRFKELVDRLYTQGLPWVKPRALTGMGLQDSDIPKDCFVGFNDEGEERTGQRVLKLLEGRSGEGFKARRVRVNDPSEIIFYTESAAFPAAYVSELYDENGLQRYYEDSARAGAALHSHRDAHQLQDLLPLREGGVRQLKQAWKLFVLGLLVGRIRVDQPSADDETRFHYVYRRPVSAFEQRWESLGAEMAAIQRLVDDSQLMQTLSRDVEDSRSAIEAAGMWGELLALADYYFHCIYPVHKERVANRSGGAEIAGSIENEAVNEIRDEEKQRAKSRGGLSEAELMARVQAAVSSLETWARPIARMPGRSSPWSYDLRAEDREFEWSLLDVVRERLPSVPGYLPARSVLGEVERSFTRLRIEHTEQPRQRDKPTSPRAQNATPSLYHYAGPGGREAGLSAAAIAERVQGRPAGQHRIWRAGLPSWVAPKDEPGVHALLAELPPALVDDDVYEVARDKERLGAKAAPDIAALAQQGGAAIKVWRKGWAAWLPALDVSAIRALFADEPPALDDAPSAPDDSEPPSL